jgi:hypothetical protein
MRGRRERVRPPRPIAAIEFRWRQLGFPLPSKATLGDVELGKTMEGMRIHASEITRPWWRHASRCFSGAKSDDPHQSVRVLPKRPTVPVQGVASGEHCVGAEEPQVPPLRFAPVGMTILSQGQVFLGCCSCIHNRIVIPTGAYPDFLLRGIRRDLVCGSP